MEGTAAVNGSQESKAKIIEIKEKSTPKTPHVSYGTLKVLKKSTEKHKKFFDSGEWSAQRKFPGGIIESEKQQVINKPYEVYRHEQSTSSDTFDQDKF